MKSARLDKRKAPSAQAPAARMTEERVKEQLAMASGTEAFQHRDPIYHLTESFRQTFDLMGQKRASGQQPDLDAMLQLYMRDETPGLWGADEQEGRSGLFPGEQDETGGMSPELFHRTSMKTDYEPREQDPRRRSMDRFADISFQRGRLSAAVVRGTGKMMLFSCLERTVGQQEVKQRRERKLFQSNSLHRLIPGQREDISIVNRGFADSAVGLVVDTLKDARQVLDSFTALAEGKGGSDGMGTLHKQYPFLTDAPERELLEEYRARLAQLKGPGCQEEREVLKRAQEKAEAVIGKKDQMKRDFLQRLRQLSHNATAALAEFASEDLIREAAQRLDQITEIPPPDEGDDDGGGDPGNDGERP